MALTTTKPQFLMKTLLAIDMNKKETDMNKKETKLFGHKRVYSTDLEALNPLEAALIENEEITAYGRCPYCKCSMNPERWFILSNGYECLECGHKTFLMHEEPYPPCDCSNCIERRREADRVAEEVIDEILDENS